MTDRIEILYRIKIVFDYIMFVGLGALIPLYWVVPFENALAATIITSVLFVASVAQHVITRYIFWSYLFAERQNKWSRICGR